MIGERDVYAVDLDGTLAYDESHMGGDHIGTPVPPMLKQVQQWLDDGIEVWIFTARLSDAEDRSATVTAIQDWLEQHGLPRLKVTNRKSFRIKAYFDDRAYHVLHDQGVVTETVEDH